jgi:hypothetical protein
VAAGLKKIANFAFPAAAVTHTWAQTTVGVACMRVSRSENWFTRKRTGSGSEGFVKVGIEQGRANRIVSREEARARLCRRTLALFGATAYGASTVRLAAGTIGGRTLATGDFERNGWLDSLAFKKGSFGWGWELGASP